MWLVKFEVVSGAVLGFDLKGMIYRERQLIRGNEQSKNNSDDNYNLV